MANEMERVSLDHFRLKSRRRKERLKHGESEKSLMRLYREYDALGKQQRDLGFERLEPPVLRGYKRYFVLRPEVARSREAKLFQGILDRTVSRRRRINTTQYSSRKDFKKKRRRGGKKVYDPPTARHGVRSQELQRLWTWTFKEKKFTEQEAAYFDFVMTDERAGSYFRWTYVFREAWRFQLKIEPNVIRWTLTFAKASASKIKDFDLERRISEIDRYIESNHLWPHIHKVLHGSYQWSGRHAWSGELERYKYDPLKNRPFAEVLDEYWPGERIRMEIEKPSDDEGFFYVFAAQIFCPMSRIAK